jgi:hypothetical protein
MKLGHEGGPADAGGMVPGDHQAETGGKLWLLHQAEGFGGVADPLYVGEADFQNGFVLQRLERVVVYEQDCRHGDLGRRGAWMGRPAELTC